MTDADLDLSYTALCEALAQAGPERAQMLLAMLSLQLIAKAGSAQEVLPLIAQAHAACGEGAAPQWP